MPQRPSTPARDDGAIGHYNRKTLEYTSEPIALKAVACRSCGRTMPPERAIRDEGGEWRCRNRAACTTARLRGERGGK